MGNGKNNRQDTPPASGAVTGDWEVKVKITDGATSVLVKDAYLSPIGADGYLVFADSQGTRARFRHDHVVYAIRRDPEPVVLPAEAITKFGHAR